MRHLIVGAGEVGRSLHQVLSAVHNVFIRDAECTAEFGRVDIMHVCFPCGPGEDGSRGFMEAVRGYQKRYCPNITVIHSTVPIGTSRELGAVHSPIHGKHPDLSLGIRTFVKYVGGEDMEDVKAVAMELLAAGISVRIVDDSITSEASKICCTSYYGMAITYAKDVKAFCDKIGANFEQVYGWNRHYNAGYTALGMGQFVRPVLEPTPGPIGGHCVAQNCRLVPDEPFARYITDRNEVYKLEKDV